MLGLGEHGDWIPPIVETVASAGEGLEVLWKAIDAHRLHLGSDGLERRRRRRRKADLNTALASALRDRATALADSDADLLGAVERGETDPWTAAAFLAGA